MEQVLVVPRQALAAADLLDQGFRAVERRVVEEIVVGQGQFLDRPRAEEDPAWKQIIPYGVVCWSGCALLLRRSKRGGEPRLHDRLSIGVGGHVNPEPVPRDQWVDAGLRRELEEELLWRSAYRTRFLGTVNDDSNDVGRVHFGLVFLVSTPTPDVEVRETDLLEGDFVRTDVLRESQGDMETWSQLVASALLENDLLGVTQRGL